MSIDHFSSTLTPLLSSFLLVCSSLYGCSSAQDSPRSDTNQRSLGLLQPAPGSEPVATLVDARPAAMIDGSMVTWGQLRPALTEAAGAQALHDLIIDHKLADALRQAGISISDQDVENERSILLQSLNDDPNSALLALDDLRAREGIGSTRFAALLTRNAALRKLVQPQVDITDSLAQRMYDILHGPKRQARIITAPNLAAAQAARTRVLDGEPFADVAVSASSDSSATRGGLLEPIALSDSAYPQSLRDAIFCATPGQVSNPVLLDSSYAIILVLKDLPADNTTFDDVRPHLLRLCRLQQERVLMQQLARSFLRAAAVSVFDPALKESWDRWRPHSPAD